MVIIVIGELNENLKINEEEVESGDDVDVNFEIDDI